MDLNSYGAHPEVPLQIFLGRNISPWSALQSVITHVDESRQVPSALAVTMPGTENSNCRALVSSSGRAVTSPVSGQVAFESRLHSGWRQQETAGPPCPWRGGQPDLVPEVTAAIDPQSFLCPQQLKYTVLHYPNHGFPLLIPHSLLRLCSQIVI